MRILLVVLLLAGSSIGLAQERDDVPPPTRKTRAERMRTLQAKAMRLLGTIQTLGDWDEHYEYMLDATERVFERNGWDGESDLFTLEMIREVGKIPPWDPQQRIEAAMQMIGDRYLLDDGQIASLQSQVISMNIELFSKHADQIIEYATEAIETRVAGEPFTPEQVARWSKLAEPVFMDARRGINEKAREFMEELDPEQRELLQQDLDAANRRMSDVLRMSQEWKRGEWDPSDWGMEDDPIQNRGRKAAKEAAGSDVNSKVARAAERSGSRRGGLSKPEQPDGKRRSVGKTVVPQADDAWARYVRAFIRKYRLNDEQQQRAWIFYRYSKDRDRVFARRHQRQMKNLHSRDRGGDDRHLQAATKQEAERRARELDRLFDQLKQRLERLPTRAQRRNARPTTSRPVPASRKEP